MFQEARNAKERKSSLSVSFASHAVVPFPHTAVRQINIDQLRNFIRGNIGRPGGMTEVSLASFASCAKVTRERYYVILFRFTKRPGYSRYVIVTRDFANLLVHN